MLCFLPTLSVGAPRIELGPHVPETCILPLYYAPRAFNVADLSKNKSREQGWVEKRFGFEYSVAVPQYGPVAQLVEQRFCKAKVAGSNPVRSTKHSPPKGGLLFCDD